MSITINHDGDTWRIIGQGSLRDGKVYCHLASTTRSRQQRNGSAPVQIADWIDQKIILLAAVQAEAILSAAIQAEEEQRKQRAITAYYTDRNRGGWAR